MKNAVFLDYTVWLLYELTIGSVRRLLVTANVVPSSPILVTLMMEALRSETSVLTRATRRNIPEDGILPVDETSAKSEWYSMAPLCAI
jgi:hypothetical protein